MGLPDNPDPESRPFHYNFLCFVLLHASYVHVKSLHAECNFLHTQLVIQLKYIIQIISVENLMITILIIKLLRL